MSDGPARSPSSEGGPDETPRPSDLERRLERHFLEADDVRDVPPELLGDSVDTEEALRLLALNDLAEEGLELLEREGIGAAVGGVGEGRRLGDYRLLQEIGSGGMGLLYLAEDTVLGRLVAVKLLSRATSTTTARFKREAEITASLDHPHIVPVYGRGEADGVHYIVMRYVAGKDIEGTLTQSKAAGKSGATTLYDQAVGWCAQVAEGLHYAHEAGVIHRDVKPGNILVENDTPYLVDFGLATHDGDLSLTQPGDLLGTVPYMSPEQIRAEGGGLDRRADVYSLGATLYQLLAGVVPFAGRSSQAIARQILTRDPPALRRYGVPRDLEAIVFRAMEKDREKRYPTAQELRRDLERYLDRSPVKARHLGPMRRAARIAARKKGITALVSLLVVATVTGGVLFWRSHRREQDLAVARMEEAESLGRRGLHVQAAVVLERLLTDRPEDAAARRLLRRQQLYDIRDQLMELMYIRPDESSGAHGVSLSTSAMTEPLRRAGEIGAAETLSDQFRFLGIVHLKRRGLRAEARGRLDAWEAELGAPTRRTACLRAYVASDAKNPLRARELMSRLEAHPARDPMDSYFTALVLALDRADAAVALREMDVFLEARPSSFWGRFIRGNLLRYLRRYGEAREVFGALMEAASPGRLATTGGGDDRKRRAASYMRGLMNGLLGDYDRALTDLARSGGVVHGWTLRRAEAHCRLRLGETDRAVGLYEEALAELVARRETIAAEASGEEGKFLARAVDRSRRRILTELFHARKSTGRWEEADAVVERLLALPEGMEAGETMRLVLGLEHAMVVGLSGDDDGAMRALGELAEEADELVQAWPENRILELLRLEVRFLAGDETRKHELLETFLAREVESVEGRLWRAKIALRYVMQAKQLLFDRTLRADASEAERSAWFGFIDDIDRYTRRAADDLGVFERDGFDDDRLLALFERDAIVYLYGLARLWRGEPRTAARILAEVVRRRERAPDRWLPSVLFFHGQALEGAGREEEALAAYRRSLALRPSEAWSLSVAGRLAARLEHTDALTELFELMERHGPTPDWRRGELRAKAYDAIRGDSRFASVFED